MFPCVWCRRTSVPRILGHEKRKQYIIDLFHVMNTDDPGGRMEFCEWLLHMHDKREHFPGFTAYSDETIFTVRISRHNYVYWVTEKAGIREQRGTNQGCQCDALSSRELTGPL
jgi:hypothetical protein